MQAPQTNPHLLREYHMNFHDACLTEVTDSESERAEFSKKAN